MRGTTVDGNDLHFLKDSLALIQHSRAVPGFGGFYFDVAGAPTVGAAC